MELHLKIIGIVLVALSLSHLAFPVYFKWARELSSLSLVNRQMVYVHTLFIALAVLLMGLLCITSSDELIRTPFGRRIALGLGVFWAFRFFIQFFGYSAALWKGKKFETAIHIFFTVFWAYASIVFLTIWA